MIGTRQRVLLVELNEMTWDLIDPLIEQGKLPTFARLKQEGTCAAPMSVDLPPQLDPWITWTTVYTGRPQTDHNVFFLQQEPKSIRAPRIWEICSQHGLSVGVYGSLCSWPPQKVKGFYVPDTFAQDSSTFPESLEPIQTLNLTYTRSIRLRSDEDSLWFKARLAGRLSSLGLTASTAGKILKQLARERVQPESRWRRVALQPLVNLDFFGKLYREHKPDFASFHSNHVAHYQHTYWKAMQPERFEQESSQHENETYGGAIEHGYRVADCLLEKMLDMIESDTVLVVASSMGQRPFIADHREGKEVSQIRSLDELLRLIGATDSARALATMSDQFNIYPESGGAGEAIMQALAEAYVDTPGQPMFYAYSVDHAITVNLRPYLVANEGSRCYFPTRGTSAPFEGLVYRTGHVKSGCHDPTGMMLLHGAGIRRGGKIDDCSNLDIAPTLLRLLGIEAEPEMKGRILREAFSESAAFAAR